MPGIGKKASIIPYSISEEGQCGLLTQGALHSLGPNRCRLPL